MTRTKAEKQIDKMRKFLNSQLKKFADKGIYFHPERALKYKIMWYEQEIIMLLMKLGDYENKMYDNGTDKNLVQEIKKP